MRILRFLLFPLSLIYGSLVWIRNWLYDTGFLKSFHLEITTIAVGNLTVGGTGKTPMVEFLVRLLKDRYRIVMLSRGYKRKSRGFRLAGPSDTAQSIGDEPAQILMKFNGEIVVAVCEDRLYAIPKILDSNPDTDLIILDDAFQHRGIKPDCNILLTDYHRPFYDDWLLPSGNLRENRRNARRADMIIVTKCPMQMKQEEYESMAASIIKYVDREIPVFFMNILYDAPVPAFDSEITMRDQVILVSGIAHDKNLVDHVAMNYQLRRHFKYPDHHFFSEGDIRKITEYYRQMDHNDTVILFTEKDIARLRKSKDVDILMDYPIFFQPITYKFARNGSEFEEIIGRVLVKIVE